MTDQGSRLEYWSWFLASLVTTLSGWAGLKSTSIALFYMGFAGAIPMILIEGVHGGGTRVENIIGGFLFVTVNIFFYRFVFRWMLVKMFGDKRKPEDSL